MKVYKGDYNRSEFYSLMGKFFAERKYKTLMPYLVNRDEYEWHIKTDKSGEVLGFISFKESKDRVDIGYFFVDDVANKEKIQDEIIIPFYKDHLQKDIYIDVEKHFNIDVFLQLGFEIIKESTNYYYLVRRKSYEII